MTGSSEAQRPESELTDELRRARVSGKRLPDFFIVGHAKCGTTAMYEMLKGHPQIYLPRLKEPQFLARNLQDGAKPTKRNPTGLGDYLSLFEPAGHEQRAGEASTTYLRTPSAAGHIAELCPDARIIAILREPASFLVALHLQLLRSGIETEPDFAAAIGLEPARRRGTQIPRDLFWSRALLYSEHVRYVEQLRRYHELFGRERVLTLIYDDFRRDNERVARQILRFLEVDDSFEMERSEANPTVRVRSPRAEKLMHAVSVGRGPVSRGAKAALKAVTTARLRRAALAAAKQKIVDSQPSLPDPKLIEDLRRRFKPEVVAASKYLERDLVDLWEYDDVG